MRFITLSLLFIFSLSCANSKKIAMKPNPLNGTWVPVSQEMGGTVLPRSFYETQQLIINDSNYTVKAESIDRGVVVYDHNKMDIFSKEGENKGKHFKAIFKHENELLTICYNLTGDAYPEAFETKGKPMYFLSVFKKE
jgi:uncharacterized protein (TIGR03067 family)